jgi:SNF2 family DNA or RNA helicase
MAVVSIRRVSAEHLALTPDARELAALGRAVRGAVSSAVRRRGNRIIIGASDAPSLIAGLPPEWTFTWEDDARAIAENRRRVQSEWLPYLEGFRQLKAGGVSAARAALPTTADLARLDDHQLVNVALMTMDEGFGLCVFDEQGVGKTVMVIEAFDVLVQRNKADRLIIAAPKSMLGEWDAEFLRFKRGLYKVAIVTGTRAERQRAIHAGADVIVANFETIGAMLGEFIGVARRGRGRTVLVVDESFHVKNRDARRTAAILELREWCHRAFVLCGTPAPNAPHDVTTQLSIIDFGHAFAGVRVPDDRAEARPVVRAVMEERCAYTRNMKAEVLPGLPEKVFTRTLVEFEPLQARSYHEALNALVEDIRRTTDVEFNRDLSSFLQRRAALLQICSNPAGVVKDYEELPAKMAALDLILSDLIERQDEKVIVWSFYTASLWAIARRFERYGVVAYDGSVSVADRRAAIRGFQEDPAVRLFVGNPAAGGAGVTLHRARYAIYESMSQQAAHFLQSVDRIHRRGQEREVEYLVLLCRDSIEEAEYQRLLDKEAAQRDLLGDGDAGLPVRRDQFLAELCAQSPPIATGGRGLP